MALTIVARATLAAAQVAPPEDAAPSRDAPEEAPSAPPVPPPSPQAPREPFPPAPGPAAPVRSEPEIPPQPQPQPQPAPPAGPPIPLSISPGLLPGSRTLKIEGPAGSIKFGLLVQPQYQAVGSPSADGLTEDLYLRRVRFMAGGTFLGYFSYFWQIDSPNLFKTQSLVNNGVATTQLTNAGFMLNDAYLTFQPAGELFKVDGGYFLPPLAHNYLQSAATLLAWDYFSNTYRAAGFFGDPGGHDTGFQVRGLVLDGHVNYRIGVFQGVRNQPIAAASGHPARVGGRNSFRVAGRLQLNLLDAETSTYYNGTYLGAQKVLSLGAAYDFENDYRSWAVDGIADLPLGPGVWSTQVNYVYWNGGALIAGLPEESAIMGETGYVIAPIYVSPIVRYEHRSMWGAATAALPNETRYAAGLAFWPFAHNVNVKIFYTRVQPDPGREYDQVNAQWQLFFY